MDAARLLGFNTTSREKLLDYIHWEQSFWECERELDGGKLLCLADELAKHPLECALPYDRPMCLELIIALLEDNPRWVQSYGLGADADS